MINKHFIVKFGDYKMSYINREETIKQIEEFQSRCYTNEAFHLIGQVKNIVKNMPDELVTTQPPATCLCDELNRTSHHSGLCFDDGKSDFGKELNQLFDEVDSGIISNNIQ